MTKHLNMTTFDSGLLNLIKLHESTDTDYRHLSMKFTNNDDKMSLNM